MSKRYGRNQKRQHLEEIARLNEALAMSEGLAAHLAKELRQARETIDQMIQEIEAVCEYSAALPPKEVKGSAPVDHYQVGIPELPPHSRVTMDDVVPSKVSISTVNVSALRSYLRQHHKDFCLAVHLEYSVGRHSAYMISEAALYRMPDDVLFRRVALDIVEKLIRHLKKRKGEE